MYFLYPSDPFHKKRPDEFYAAEFAAIRAAGFATSVFSLEDFQAGSFLAYPPLPATTVIYRGWMLAQPDYEALVAAIGRSGARSFTDTPTYLFAHYLPNWYPLIAEFTSGAIPSIVSECALRMPSRFFSIDVTRRADGVLRVVEIGDGQVSDLVGWTPDDFASIFKAFA